MRESILYKILSLVHIIFFLSILCFGTIFLSLTILMVPAVTAAFLIGKELIYKEYDITDGLIKKYFRYLKESLHLMKYAGINLAAALNIGGVLLGIRMGQTFYAVLCLTVTAALYTMVIYTAGYYTFVDQKFTLAEAFICMLYKPGFLIPVLAVMVLLVFFFRRIVGEVLLVIGAFPMLVLEIVVFIHTLHYRKLRGELPDEDLYAHLVNGKKNQGRSVD